MLLGEDTRLIEKFLDHRGLDAETYARLDSPYQDKLQNLDSMVDALRAIRQSGDKIVVLPDFDMDGIMSGVIGRAGLCDLGFNAELFIPDPNKGYGFNAAEMARLIQEHPDVRCVITCDTGISCAEGVKYARDAGLIVLVTDHHAEDPTTTCRPYANIVVDPCAIGETYRLSGICGAYVLWQVLFEYACKYENRTAQDRIARLRVFAGIGTVSDVMPLQHQNRQLVRDAVSISQMVWSNGSAWFIDALDGCTEYKQAFFGLHQVFYTFSKTRQLSGTLAIDESFFAFYLAPTFNSCKRMSADMHYAFDIFCGINVDDNAQRLVQLNTTRKSLVTTSLRILENGDNRYAPYVYYMSGVLPGIVGLLAQEMLKRTGRPCVVVLQQPDGTWSGSGRSPEWYPCRTNACNAGFHLAGHETAFGVKLADTQELRELARFLEQDSERVRDELIAKGIFDLEPSYDFTVSVEGDGDIDLDLDAFENFIEDIDQFHPFGAGFPEPSIKLTFDGASATHKTMSSGAHLKFLLPMGFDVLCFRQGDKLKGANLNCKQTVIGTIEMNHFMGANVPQFRGDWNPIYDKS